MNQKVLRELMMSVFVAASYHKFRQYIFFFSKNKKRTTIENFSLHVFVPPTSDKDDSYIYDFIVSI